MAKLKKARDLVDAIKRELKRRKMSRYMLANLVAWKIGGNAVNIDRRVSRLFSGETRVDLGFALEVCDRIGLTVSVERDKK